MNGALWDIVRLSSS